MLTAMSSDRQTGGAGGQRKRLIARPLVPPGPRADLKSLIYELYLAAGTPALHEITQSIAEDDELAGAPGRDTVTRIIGDPDKLCSLADVVAVVTVLARAARRDEKDAADRARDLWVAARKAPAVGVPLDKVTDPFAREVHRPVILDGVGGLAPLPRYVRRAHDGRLAELAARAAAGSSVMAVLVAGSSAGKTRACWEALEVLRQAGRWRLWHPYDPGRPAAVLRELAAVGPRTVVWLNETQEYLGASDGERVAAGLRSLLADPARAPVLVLGTLWPEHYADLTQQPGSQVRALIDGTVVEVPGAFTGADLAAWQQAAPADPRLAWAAEHAENGQITQQLSGGPEQLQRYLAARPAAKALIQAAMDARRLGMSPALPLAFLETAAPGYLADAEWDTLGEDWAEQALAYTAVPCKGARGLLTRIRPRPARPRPGRASARPQEPATGQACRLADYLDQHGRAERAGQIPPPDFWAAAAAHATPSDQAALGEAAHDRGLYRDAAQLRKNAAAAGNLPAAVRLSLPPSCLRADSRPASWAATHAPLDDPAGVARLLDSLRKAGADMQAAALLARDPAACASLDDPYGVAALLGGLLEAGADMQVAALLARDPAACASLDDPAGMALLRYSLLEAGADEQAAALARRAAACTPLDVPPGVAKPVGLLRMAGATLGATLCELFFRQPGAGDEFRFGREADGTPAAPWGWDDLD